MAITRYPHGSAAGCVDEWASYADALNAGISSVTYDITETSDTVTIFEDQFTDNAVVDITAAPPSFRSASFNGVLNSPSFSVARPTGSISGDRLILVFHMPAGETTTPTITGYTKLSGFDQAGSPKFCVYTRVADGTGADAPSFSTFSGANAYAGLALFAFTASTIDASVVVQTNTSTSHYAPAVTSLHAGSLAVHILIVGNVPALTPISGATNRANQAANYYSIACGTTDMPVIGTTASPLWTTPSSSNSAGYSFTLLV